jgi:hypothetical protein
VEGLKNFNVKFNYGNKEEKMEVRLRRKVMG